MHKLRTSLLAISLAWSGAALGADAQSQPAQPIMTEHRLSPAEIERVLADAARKREHAEPASPSRELEDDNLPPPIHGEVGFSVGTGGYRSAFGTAIIPLAGDGVAILSFGTGRFRSDGDFDHFRW